MGWLKFTYSPKEEAPLPPERKKFKLAMKKFSEARYKDDLEAQATLEVAYEFSHNFIFDRFQWFNTAISYYCGQRIPEDIVRKERCKEICRECIDDAPQIIEAYKKEYHKESLLDFIPPEIPAFQRLAALYEESGNYEQAIDVCRTALTYQQRDGTPGGFHGRIERLQKKLERR
jgi:tetratricopeptide (TPR) repeat protein